MCFTGCSPFKNHAHIANADHATIKAIYSTFYRNPRRWPTVSLWHVALQISTLCRSVSSQYRCVTVGRNCYTAIAWGGLGIKKKVVKCLFEVDERFVWDAVQCRDVCGKWLSSKRGKKVLSCLTDGRGRTRVMILYRHVICVECRRLSC